MRMTTERSIDALVESQNAHAQSMGWGGTLSRDRAVRPPSPNPSHTGAGKGLAASAARRQQQQKHKQRAEAKTAEDGAQMRLCSVRAELSRSVETLLTFAVRTGRGAGGDGRRAGGRDRLPARLRPRRRRMCHIMIAGKKEERPGQDCARTMLTVARVSNIYEQY